MENLTQAQENKRKLATVQKIADFFPIPGADFIQTVLLEGLGWECVINKKDNFKVGDLVCFFEIDSLLPERSEFEFLREGKFRIRTRKYKKQVSQGLIMPMSILPPKVYSAGEDVTDILGVTNYVKSQEKTEESNDAASALRHSKVPRFLMDMAWFRWVYFKLNTFDKGWPSWIQKSDETRIQVCAKLLIENFDKEWYITEKCDGQSFTFFTYFARRWGIMRKLFGVCSRNIWLHTPTNSSYWTVAKAESLEKKLKGLTGTFPFTIQAEILGPGIQKNKYGFSQYTPFIFTVVENGKRLSLESMEFVCQKLGVKMVPVVNRSFVPLKEIGEGKTVQEVVQYMVNLSKGKSVLANRNREGIVCRLVSNPDVSLKVINPDFLLEEKD